MIFSLLYVLEFLAVAHAAPQVQMGNTTIDGLDITGLNLDFFGGMIFTVFLCVVRGSSLFYRDSFRRTSLGRFAFESPRSQNTA